MSALIPDAATPRKLMMPSNSKLEVATRLRNKHADMKLNSVPPPADQYSMRTVQYVGIHKRGNRHRTTSSFGTTCMNLLSVVVVLRLQNETVLTEKESASSSAFRT